MNFVGTYMSRVERNAWINFFVFWPNFKISLITHFQFLFFYLFVFVRNKGKSLGDDVRTWGAQSVIINWLCSVGNLKKKKKNRRRLAIDYCQTFDTGNIFVCFIWQIVFLYAPSMHWCMFHVLHARSNNLAGHHYIS